MIASHQRFTILIVPINSAIITNKHPQSTHTCTYIRASAVITHCLNLKCSTRINHSERGRFSLFTGG